MLGISCTPRGSQFDLSASPDFALAASAGQADLAAVGHTCCAREKAVKRSSKSAGGVQARTEFRASLLFLRWWGCVDRSLRGASKRIVHTG